MSRIYDPAPVFDFIPSFWRDCYEERDQIARLWEAFVRLMDDEFAQAEQVNLSTYPGTCPIYIYHTYLYRKLDDWKSYGVPHSHYRKDFRATAGQSIFYLGFWPDPASSQVFLDGKELDPSSDSYIISFDQDATQPGTNPAGARLIFAHPNIAGTSVSLFTDRRLFRTEATITSSGLSSLSFPEPVDPDVLRLIVRKLDITADLVITATGFSWRNLTPGVPDNRIFRRGELFELYDAVTGVSTALMVQSDSSSVVVAIPNPASTTICRTINLDISHGKIKLSGNVLSTSGQSIPVSLRFRAADVYGSEGCLITRPATTLSFTRDFDPSSQAVYFLGGRIDGGHTSSASEIVFERSFMQGVTLLVEAPISEANDHASFRTVLATLTDTVILPPTRPLVLTPLLQEKPQYPIKVFVDGILQHPDTYTFISTSQIRLAAPVPPGTVVDVIYVDLEDPKDHLHVHEEFKVTVPTSAFSLAGYVDAAASPSVSVDGVLMSDPEQVRFSVDGRFLRFHQPLATGSIVQVLGSHESYRYFHALDAELVQADYLQNGIDQKSDSIPGGWTIQLEWDVGFRITKGLLETNAKIKDAWFVNAYLDEGTANKNFGSLLGISRETSKSYVDVVRAVFSGNYMGSQPATIENYACILLGSDYFTKAEKVSSISGLTVTTDGGTYTLIEGVPSRVVPAKNYPKYHAISETVKIIDDWDAFDALALMGSRFSDDYTFAATLDEHKLTILEGRSATFYAEEKKMVDPNIDFIKNEVWVGDLIAMYDAGTPTIPAYGRITKVEQHVVYADVPINVTVSGYGDGYYGQWVYGGGYSIIPIDRYKIWNRKTNRLDWGTRFDAADPEDVAYLSSVLHDLYSPFVFLAEIRWRAVRNDTALRDVIRFLDKTKPADTNYFAYAKTYEGELKDAIAGAVADADPTWTVVPNYFFVSTDVGGFIGINGQVSPNVGSFVGP